MKIGLISDIHGNAEALAAVLELARDKGVERFLCCGDIVGYYYEPGKCFDLLSGWKLDCVMGNHEEMLLRMMDDPLYGSVVKEQYGSGLSVALEILTKEQLDYLSHLPEKKLLNVGGKSVLLCHGAPWDNNCYVYPDADNKIFELCTESGTDYVVLGHTHYQLSVRHGEVFIINPGSVGQPRGKYKGVAHWAILDISSGWHEHLTVEYNPSSVIAQARKYDPDVIYLQNILMRSLE